MDLIELADWRRALADLYAEVRQLARRDPVAAHARWRMVREMLYRQHAQSPVPADQRGQYRGLYFPYNPEMRFEVRVECQPSPSSARVDHYIERALPGATASTPRRPLSRRHHHIPNIAKLDQCCRGSDGSVACCVSSRQ